MKKMVTSVSLPESVLDSAEEVAREMHKSRSELIKDALVRFIEEHRWKKMQDETRVYALRAGVRTEEDVENLIRDIRAPKYGKR